MPWVRLDDHMHGHEKITAISNDALAVWVCSLTYCAEHLTDGALTRNEARSLLALRGVWDETADELVAIGLWERTDDGFQVHDYLQYNPSHGNAKAKSKARAESGRIGGLRSAESRRSKIEAKPEANVQANAKEKGNPVPVPVPGPGPGSPEISRGNPEKSTNGNEKVAAATTASPSRATSGSTRTNGSDHPTNQQALFGAICTEFGITEPLTDDERSLVGKVARQLDHKGLVAPDIPDLRWAVEEQLPKGSKPGPAALAKYASALQGYRSSRGPPIDPMARNAEILRRQTESLDQGIDPWAEMREAHRRKEVKA